MHCLKDKYKTFPLVFPDTPSAPVNRSRYTWTLFYSAVLSKGKGEAKWSTVQYSTVKNGVIKQGMVPYCMVWHGSVQILCCQLKTGSSKETTGATKVYLDPGNGAFQQTFHQETPGLYSTEMYCSVQCSTVSA